LISTSNSANVLNADAQFAQAQTHYNGRPERRKLICPVHQEKWFGSNRQKYFLRLLRQEELRE
jgi:hypothetical protein